MPRITDVVKNLLILNVLMYFGTYYLMGDNRYTLAMFYPNADYDFFRPYQIVTHMFMHGGTTHLLFNMFALYMFGSAVETRFGPKRFLLYYFVTGFGALALYLFVKYLEINVINTGVNAHDLYRTPMLGASGAVFGLLAAFGMLFPNAIITLIIPPIPMKAKYFVLIYAVLELFLGVSRFDTGIAHFAHLGGALFGFLLILYWKKTGNLV